MSALNAALDRARSLVARKRPEPSYPTVPQVSESAESSVPGIYLAGEVGGVPLIKLGLNQGVEIVDRLRAELGEPPADDPELLDLVIVGAGSSGLGAAMRAQELGMRYVVIEAERIATTVVNMYKGKLLFAEPLDVPNKSGMWFEECTREQLLDRWRKQVADSGLAVREHERVEDIRGSRDAFRVVSDKGEYRCRRVILALGKAGNPRKAGVPGEGRHPEKLLHTLSDPDAYRDRDVLVYGGGDVAAEATLALCKKNRVTMVTIDRELTFPKKRNVDALLEEQAAGRLELHLSSKLIDFDETSATFENAQGERKTLDNDVVFEMIGATLPLPFFRRVGIRLEGDWYVRRWLYLAVVCLFVYTLYALKKYPEAPFSWPFNRLIEPHVFNAVLAKLFAAGFLPFRWMFADAAYADMLATHWFQQSYLYSLAYTIVFLVFGYMAMKRWTGIARDGRYQKWRYITLGAFQLGFFLAANVVAVQAMAIDNAWRTWGLYQPWPLFFNTFHNFAWWNDSDPRAVMFFFIGFGLFLTLVAIPWASRKHGKRFCTWICGCGGLAETLGDRWRHLAPKGKRSRAWEFQGAVILVAALIVTLVTVGMFETKSNNVWALAYSYIVDFWLVAVIPVALYPFFGGKVWCRYWCPLAAWNQILAHAYGRLRIESNDKCISCAECSRYCQVGVDVMAFAKNQQAFDNANSSCIHCGICIDVCPMDVLSFSLKPTGHPRLPVLNGRDAA